MTISCAERGLLLVRVRDEIHMTIAAYQTMYESSVAFSLRKSLRTEQDVADMKKRVRARIYLARMGKANDGCEQGTENQKREI